MSVRRIMAPAAVVAGVLAAAGLATPAFADAALRETTPRDGATVAEAPGEVRFTFNEDLQERFTTVKVTRPGGTAVVVDKAVTDGPTVTQPLPGTLEPGQYTVAFRIVSADGHPVSGKTTFRVQVPPASPSATAQPSEPAPATTATSAAAIPAEDDGGAGVWLWVIGGVILAAVVGVLVAGRRRRPSNSV
ncbi:copper resistance CopC family protein [Actinoplanes sp. CA-142083]|uniref:copper resistance CopC family protein n=1 Tax=Actinoplanes sp. CA-142083 TaxID=3239903 RepID=UPI003D8E3C32